MIRLILRRVGVGRFPKPRVMVCVPSAITEVERRAVKEAAEMAGARDVVLVEEPLAAAIGANLPVHEPIGNLIVDIGGGTSEMAVVSMGGIVAGKAVRVGGFDMDAAVQAHVRKVYGIAVGERTAEQIKMAIGSAYPTAGIPTARVRGRELATGLPKAVEVPRRRSHARAPGPRRPRGDPGMPAAPGGDAHGGGGRHAARGRGDRLPAAPGRGLVPGHRLADAPRARRAADGRAAAGVSPATERALRTSRSARPFRVGRASTPRRRRSRSIDSP